MTCLLLLALYIHYYFIHLQHRNTYRERERQIQAYNKKNKYLSIKWYSSLGFYSTDFIHLHCQTNYVKYVK